MLVSLFSAAQVPLRLTLSPVTYIIRTGCGGLASGFTEFELLVLSQAVHVEISIGLHPVFMGSNRERPDEAQAAFGVWE